MLPLSLSPRSPTERPPSNVYCPFCTMSTPAKSTGETKKKANRVQPRPKAKGGASEEKKEGDGAGDASRAGGDVSPGGRDEVRNASTGVCERVGADDMR